MILLVGVACDETPTVEVAGECWPIDTAVAGEGSIVLGSGIGEFAVFDDGQDAIVEAGGQGGYHIRVLTRIEGLKPGGSDIQKNPLTLLTMLDKNGETINGAVCPSRIPYGIQGDGLELLRDVSMVFPIECRVRGKYNNEPVTLRAEIIDANGNFAVTEHTVIARFPKLPSTFEIFFCDIASDPAPKP